MSKVILFQGDSITDAGRDKQSFTSMGRGYPMLVQASLGLDNPNEYQFYNRGISGNRIPDVYARIVKDILFLKPDYMSLLIGVNDIWHGFHKENPNGTGAARFEKVYNLLLDELKEELPSLKIMLMEPFVLEGTATENREDEPERWNEFSNGVYELAAIVKKIANERSLTFIPLQKRLDDLAKTMPACEILSDGVHPTAIGHEFIKRAWLEAFNEIK